MAQFFKTPEDFVATTKCQSDTERNSTMALLPPSVFLSQPKPSAEREELAKTRQQITELTAQNQALIDRVTQLKNQEQQLELKQETKTPISPYALSSIDHRHLDDLIQRQVTEIQQLRGDLKQTTVDHSAEVLRLEKQILLQGECHKNDVTKYEERLGEKDETYLHQARFLGPGLETMNSCI